MKKGRCLALIPPQNPSLWPPAVAPQTLQIPQNDQSLREQLRVPLAVLNTHPRVPFSWALAGCRAAPRHPHKVLDIFMDTWIFNFYLDIFIKPLSSILFPFRYEMGEE